MNMLKVPDDSSMDPTAPNTDYPVIFNLHATLRFKRSLAKPTRPD